MVLARAVIARFASSRVLWPLAAASASLALALAGWSALRGSEDNTARMRFEQAADQSAQALTLHLRACDATLLAAISRFDDDRPIDDAGWLRLGQRLRVGEPGACAPLLAFLPQVTGPERAVHEAAHSNAGRGPYRIVPPGERDLYVPITLLTPDTADAMKSRGVDIWADPLRRAALERARDTGRPSATEPVRVPRNDTPQTIVLQYIPVYRTGWPTSDVGERRRALLGYIGLPLAHDTLLKVVSTAHPELSFDFGLSLPQPAPAAVHTERRIDYGGLAWRLRVAQRPGAVTAERWRPSDALLAGGLAFTLVATLAVLLVTDGRARAHRLAQRYSQTAREGEARLRALLDGARDAMFTLDAHGTVLDASRAGLQMLGRDTLIGLNARSLIHPSQSSDMTMRYSAYIKAARHGAPARVVEMVLARGDGTPLPVRSSLSYLVIDGHETVVWLASDMSEEHALRRQARAAEQLRSLVLDIAPVALMVVDEQGNVVSANPAAHAMFGYSAAEMIGLRALKLHLRAEVEQRRHDREQACGAPAPVDCDLFTSPCDARQRPIEIEWTMRRKDGSTLPTAMLAVRLRPSAERPLAGNLCAITDVSERKRATAQIQYLAMHDRLTGLPNRLMLEDRVTHALERARSRGDSFALLLMDLDRFKQINDTLGHAAGDEVLKGVAQRLGDHLRGGDTVARMGGDEFVVLLPDLPDAAEALRIAHKLRLAFGEEMTVHAHRLHVTPSIGVALYPAHGADLAALLKHADLAMYAAKDAGGNEVDLFDPQRHAPDAGRLQLENDLRHAIGNGELRLHYQPLVDAADGRVRSLEALLRWQHPVLGPVSPTDFIGIAEDTGEIVAIGAWALHRACADLAALRADGHAHLRMCVNISARQLTGDRLEADVRTALADAGLPPQALEIELTESMLVGSNTHQLGVLHRLREAGIHIALDDFGTGYSSLAYLSNFPASTLKVDRSFVSQIDSGEGNGNIAGAIITLARGMGMNSVAEGVETEAQRAYLAENRCDLLQGYLFSPAVPMERLPETLARIEAMPSPHLPQRLELWTPPR